MYAIVVAAPEASRRGGVTALELEVPVRPVPVGVCRDESVRGLQRRHPSGREAENDAGHDAQNEQPQRLSSPGVCSGAVEDIYRVRMVAEHDRRPWGEYTVIDEAASFKVKRITVLPGKRLSLQRHERREEHWFVVEGEGRITLDDEEFRLTPGQAIDIPVGAAHRIANPGESPLTFIEVQRGDYFGEDDIVRIEDDFGRIQQS